MVSLIFMHHCYQNGEGAAPIQRAIINQDHETGISFMKNKLKN